VQKLYSAFHSRFSWNFWTRGVERYSLVSSRCWRRAAPSSSSTPCRRRSSAKLSAWLSDSSQSVTSSSVLTASFAGSAEMIERACWGSAMGWSALSPPIQFNAMLPSPCQHASAGGSRRQNRRLVAPSHGKGDEVPVGEAVGIVALAVELAIRHPRREGFPDSRVSRHHHRPGTLKQRVEGNRGVAAHVLYPCDGRGDALHAQDARVVEPGVEAISPGRTCREAVARVAGGVGSHRDAGVEKPVLETMDVHAADFPREIPLLRPQHRRKPLPHRKRILRDIEALVAADLGREKARRVRRADAP